MIKPRARSVAIGLGLGVVLFAASAIGINRNDAAPVSSAAGIVRGAPGAIAAATNPSAQTLDQTIAGLQTRLTTTPDDDVAWATLGLAYVQQAKVTVDPTYYPKAEGALAKATAIDGAGNYLADLGRSALASARHDFAGAVASAQEGLALNSYNPLLYGALSDAQIQLGDYDAGFASIDQMMALRPDTAALTRASYAAELRGDIAGATDLMHRALLRAPTGADKAYALFYLGELAFNAGDPSTALDLYNQAIAQSPQDPAALGGKAKAEAALGQTETALDHYAELVARYPEPTYVLEYGELLQSIGRPRDAQQQYAVFVATQQLFQANGVEPDAAATLFDAAHGDPAQALVDAAAGVATRPFLTMQDANAWALHVNGRNAEALPAIERALATGMRNASFHFHAGMIKLALGDTAGARTELSTALAINPFFSPLDAPLARQALASLDAPMGTDG
jgi:tetratricopeptide (TPR) repeat protein